MYQMQASVYVLSGVRDVITSEFDLTVYKSPLAVNLLVDPAPPQISEVIPGQYVDQSAKLIYPLLFRVH